MSGSTAESQQPEGAASWLAAILSSSDYKTSENHPNVNMRRDWRDNK